MLLIAIAHGSLTDPFTTSTNDVSKQDVDFNDAKSCRDYICKDKELKPEWIDEVLVVDSLDYHSDPEVVKHHTSFED